MQMMTEDEKQITTQQLQCDLTVSVVENRLLLIVNDSNTKQTYQSSLTPQQLEDIGFSKKNVNNLHGIAKFIESAKNGQNNLQLQILITSSKVVPTAHNNPLYAANQAQQDTEEEVEGGVYGVDVSSFNKTHIAAPAAVVPPTPMEDEEIALVKISKQDAYFGTTEFVMTLPKIPRKQSDINEMRIEELTETVRQQSKLIHSLRHRVHELEKNGIRPAAITDDPEFDISEEAVVHIVEDQLDKFRQEMQHELAQKTKRISELEQKLAIKTKAIQVLEESVTELAIKEEKRRIPAVAKYQSTKEHAGWNSVQWDIVSIAPTSNGMISRLRNKDKSVIIGQDGLYRVTFRFCSNENTDWKDKYRDSGISVNGNWVAYQRHAGGNAVGEMTEIVGLRNGDEIQCGVQNKRGRAKENCSLILERIGDWK